MAHLLNNFIHRHSPPYLFLSREDGDDSRNIAKTRFLFGSTLPYLIDCHPQHAWVEIKTAILYQANNNCGQNLQDVCRCSGKGMEHYDSKQMINKSNPILNFSRYGGNAYFYLLFTILSSQTLSNAHRGYVLPVMGYFLSR